MKTIDAGYSYDELEGFEPLMPVRGRKASGIRLTVRKYTIGISADVRKILCKRNYIAISYNARTKQILLSSTDIPGDNTDKVTESLIKKLVLCYMPIRNLVEKELRFDCSVVNVRIPGTQAKSRRDSVIFDLTRAETVKRVCKG